MKSKNNETFGDKQAFMKILVIGYSSAFIPTELGASRNLHLLSVQGY